MVQIYLEGLYNNAADMEDKKCHEVFTTWKETARPIPFGDTRHKDTKREADYVPSK